MPIQLDPTVKTRNAKNQPHPEMPIHPDPAVKTKI
jgi:hypothetical protein